MGGKHLLEMLKISNSEGLSPLNSHLVYRISADQAAPGIEKQLSYRVWQTCPACADKGGQREIEVCKACCGTGKIEVFKLLFFKEMRTCKSCNDSGKVETLHCDACNGFQMVCQQMACILSIPAGVANGQIINIPEKGNQFANGAKENLAIEITIAEDHLGLFVPSPIPKDMLEDLHKHAF